MNRVERLRDIHMQIEGLRDEYKRLSVPIEMNMGMIHNLYDVFAMVLKRQNPNAVHNDTESRKKFLYAILYLFSPATLVGEVMRHRLRECVAVVLGCTPTGVSRDYKTAMFFFATYKYFQDDVNEIVREMLDVIGRTDES